MGLRIVCSGHLVRYPLGGQTWHHLQYLVGFERLGHRVTFFEDHGWPDSCYDPARDVMSSDPTYGVAYVRDAFAGVGLRAEWCFLAEDGTAHGMARRALAERCREADIYVSLSGVNWIPELEACRRRALVDTDPVFTQIGAHGLMAFDRYDALFTYGENVHRSGCEIPTAGARWRPTRQPVVLDVWPVEPGDISAPFTSVVSWYGYGDHEHEGRTYGGRARQFEEFIAFPTMTGEPMELALAAADPQVCERLRAGGWSIVSPRRVSRTPWIYQEYLRASRAEFGVAKHGYVSTRSGWFSDRSAGYLASGRPVVVQDTGFSDFLACGKGLLSFASVDEALEGIREVTHDYAAHCRAAREVAEEFFDARQVLSALLDAAMESR